MGPNRFTGSPSLLTTNLVKFHLIPLPRSPPCLLFRYSQIGWAFLPLTSILLYKSKPFPHSIPLFSAKALISALVPGS